MSKPKKKKNNQKLNKSLIEKYTTVMAMAALTGQSVPSRSVSLTVDLPEPMVKIAEHVAEVTGTELSVALAQMVKEGLSYKVQTLSRDATKEETDSSEAETPPVEFKKLEEVMTGFQSNLGNLNGLMDTLSKLSESLNGMDPSGDLLKTR